MARSRTTRKPRAATRKRPARTPGAKAPKPRATAPLPGSARIDYAKLTLQDALDLAILIEEEAQERYQKLSAMVGGRYAGDAGDVFRTMVKNEARHRDQLAERRRRLFEDAKRNVSRDALFDVEAPDWTTVRVFMSAREAMEVALESEKKAFEFFDQALPHVRDPQVRKLFEDLRREEQEHAAMLLERMKGMPPGPDVEEAMADEPGSDAG